MTRDLTGMTFTWLTAQYPTRKSGRAAWHCICQCGNEVDVITSSLTSGHTKSCGCYNSKGRIKDITNQKFGKLTALYSTDKRSGTAVVWHCKCDCGNECDVSVAHLGKTVFSCGCYRRELAKEKGIAQIPDLISKRFGNLVVIDRLSDDLFENKRWKCQCDCGKIVYHSTNELKNGHVLSCGCLNLSKGEFYLRSIFDKYNINYIPEYSVNDCRSLKDYPLRFDFYLPDYQLLIEYDGIQHFKPTRGKEMLKLQQENDKIKDLYCNDNNIELIRIPYSYNTFEMVEDFIKQTILTRCTLVKE